VQPGSALQSARSTANVHVRHRTDGNMAAPGTILRLPSSASSRTGLAANGLAPGAASLSALSTPEYAKRVACGAIKILNGILAAGATRRVCRALRDAPSSISVRRDAPYVWQSATGVTRATCAASCGAARTRRRPCSSDGGDSEPARCCGRPCPARRRSFSASARAACR